MLATPPKTRGSHPSSSRTGQLLRAIIEYADHLSWVSSLCLIVLTGIVIVDVAGRSYGSPLAGGSDIGAMLMVCIVFLALAGAQCTNDHVSMDALVTTFPPRLRAIARRLSLVVSFLVGVFLTYGTIQIAVKSFSIGEMALGGLRLPLWPAKTLVAVGLALYTLVVLAQLLEADKSDQRGAE